MERKKKRKKKRTFEQPTHYTGIVEAKETEKSGIFSVLVCEMRSNDIYATNKEKENGLSFGLRFFISFLFLLRVFQTEFNIFFLSSIIPRLWLPMLQMNYSRISFLIHLSISTNARREKIILFFRLF